MELNIEEELATLRRMTVHQLQRRYAEAFGKPTRCGHKGHLIKRIIWHLQALREGELSERARQRAAALAQNADLSLTGPGHKRPAGKPPKAVGRQSPAVRILPPAGTMLVREYKGTVLQVEVLDLGFSYDGRVYKSLSGLTRAITGKHWNGYHFFGLTKQKQA